MFTNTIKRDIKYLFNQKRYNLQSISDHCDYNDVIPFSFNEIDKIVKNRNKKFEKSIHIDLLHKNLFYKFISHTNSVIYSNVSLGKSLRSTLSETSQGNNFNNQSKTEDEIVCTQIERILGSLNKDNLIIVLQRSLSAHYYLNSKCWYRLSTITLRHCFLNEQKLESTDLVKILASLSKWRFHNLSEFGSKFDFYILLNREWDLYKASQVLWSLSHLNLFKLKAFDYLNAVISSILSSHMLGGTLALDGSVSGTQSNSLTVENRVNENGLDCKQDFYKNIHRIASANLTRLSKTGVNGPVLKSMHEYLCKNVMILKCLDSKTMLSVTALFPHSTYDDDFTTSVLDILVNSIHSFTQAQAAQIIYNFSVVHSDLSLKALELVIKLLYKFRVLVLSSDCTFIPSVVCKLLYSYRVFLNNYDCNFVSKCLSDLNANLHLIGPFSLIGNMLCLTQLVNEFGTKMDSRHRESIMNTLKNLVKFDIHGNFSKLVDGSLVPLDNMKLWHTSVINNIANLSPDCHSSKMLSSLTNFTRACTTSMNDSFNEFYETCKGDNYMYAMKNLALFMANSFGNRDLMDIHYRNLTLLTCCKLYNPLNKNEILSQYWDIIACHLQCFNLLNVFKREVEFEDGNITSISSALIKILTNTFKEGNNGYRTEVDTAMNYLRDVDCDRVLQNDEIVIIKFWELVRLCRGDSSVCDKGEINNESRHDMAKELFENFYSKTSFKITNSISDIKWLGNSDDFSDSRMEEKITKQDYEIKLKGNDKDNVNHQYISRCLESTCRPIQLDFLYSKLFFLQDHPKYFIDLVPSIIIGEALITRSHNFNIFKIAELLKQEKKWDCLLKYLDTNRGSVSCEPSSGYEALNEESTGDLVQLRGFYSNWQISDMEIDYILENQYLGAWMCPYVLKNHSNQTILIFPLKNKDDNSVHIFDKIRRDVLSKFGYNFIELCYW